MCSLPIVAILSFLVLLPARVVAAGDRNLMISRAISRRDGSPLPDFATISLLGTGIALKQSELPKSVSVDGSLSQLTLRIILEPFPASEDVPCSAFAIGFCVPISRTFNAIPVRFIGLDHMDNSLRNIATLTSPSAQGKFLPDGQNDDAVSLIGKLFIPEGVVSRVRITYIPGGVNKGLFEPAVNRLVDVMPKSICDSIIRVQPKANTVCIFSLARTSNPTIIISSLSGLFSGGVVSDLGNIPDQQNEAAVARFPLSDPSLFGTESKFVLSGRSEPDIEFSAKLIPCLQGPTFVSDLDSDVRTVKIFPLMESDGKTPLPADGKVHLFQRTNTENPYQEFDFRNGDLPQTKVITVRTNRLIPTFTFANGTVLREFDFYRRQCEHQAMTQGFCKLRVN